MKLTRAQIEREVSYVRSAFGSGEFVPTESAPTVEERCAELIQSIEVMSKAAEPLRPGDHAIVTLTRKKTAALLADRVWNADTPADLAINFGWELPMEVRLRAMIRLHDHFERSPSAPKVSAMSQTDLEGFLADLERDLALGLAKASGAAVSPLYSLASRRDLQYRGGDQAAIVCIVDHLAIVDEDQLSWEQVVEFRRDQAARKAYRHFVHWLDREMVDKPVHYIADELSLRHERYAWSLRKHGIQTMIGSLSNTLNPKSLVASSSAGLAVNVITGQPLWSLLATGGLLLGNAALSLATALVERRDLELASPEISYVHQLAGELRSDAPMSERPRGVG